MKDNGLVPKTLGLGIRMLMGQSMTAAVEFIVSGRFKEHNHHVYTRTTSPGVKAKDQERSTTLCSRAGAERIY